MELTSDRTGLEALLQVGDVHGAVGLLKRRCALEVENEVRAGLRPQPAPAMLEPVVDELWSLIAARLSLHTPAAMDDVDEWVRTGAREAKHRAISQAALKLSAMGQGDVAATLAHLFYADVIMARILGRGLRGADADDVFQDVWVRVTRQLSQYRGERDATLRTWLVRITVGAIADAFEQKRRTWARRVDAGSSFPEPLASTPKWLQSTLRPSMREELWKLLDEECTGEQREILTQRFLVDREKHLSWSELAALWPELGHPERSEAWLKLEYTKLKRWIRERLSR